jgi:osmoprotectant transport system substrate-binding protein
MRRATLMHWTMTRSANLTCWTKLTRATILFLCLAAIPASFTGCQGRSKTRIVIGSKNFTEQIVLAELLAQQFEERAGMRVERKVNLGGTLVCHKALLAGDLDLYVEYTGTALTAVLGETPGNRSADVYARVKAEYAKRFGLEVTEPLGFNNTFAMVVRGEDARNNHLRKLSDVAPLAKKWRMGVGYEFLERPDGFRGWASSYDLQFAEKPRVMDLGLLYRALKEKQVDIVAGNSTDGLIDALGLVILEDDRRYIPPYDAVPIVRQETLERVPQLRAALLKLGGCISAADMRKLNFAVDGEHRDAAEVVREFRRAKGL